MIKFLKPLSFLPAILLMYMIFSFSAQDGVTSSQLSYKVSYKVIEIGGEVLGADFQPWEIDNLAARFHGPVRKLGHMAEYFALAVAVSFPLYVYGLRGIFLLLAAGIICVGFACGDEYHQSFVEGRGPSSRDVLIDSIGIFCGIILVRIVGWTGRKTIFRPFGRKKKEEEQLREAPQPVPTVPPYHPHPGESPSVYPPNSVPYGYGPQNVTNANAQYRSVPYQNNPYPNDPYRNNAPYPNEPYRNAPYPNDPYQNPNAPYPNEPYRNAPYPNDPYQNPNDPYRSDPCYNQNPQYDPYYENEDGDEDEPVSDRLSEDMSFRKLMSDLKQQKKSSRKTEESFKE